MNTRLSPRIALSTAFLTALASVLVLFVPAANAASSVRLNPGDWGSRNNAVTTTWSGRGYVTRINDARPRQVHVSGIYARRSGTAPAPAKLDRWVRANHGKPARICAVMKGRIAGVDGRLAVNQLHRGTQATRGGFRQRTFSARTPWTKYCMDFVVIGKRYYYGDADVWLQNWESADRKDLYVDHVTLSLR